MKINHRRKNPSKAHAVAQNRDRRPHRSPVSRSKANHELRKMVDGSV